MTPYYIKRTIVENGTVFVVVGDANNDEFEAMYEIDAFNLLNNKPQIKIEVIAE